MTLRRIDLNLLPVLAALLETGSVGAAALRLGLTQAAVSQALARLRATFADPLLIRQGNRMAATPRAQALAGEMEAWTRTTQALFARPVFDPAMSEAEFVIVANDYVELTLLPALVGMILGRGPRLKLALRGVEAMPLDGADFTEGRAHLALVGGAIPAGPFESRPLFEERFVAIVRRDHPALTRPWTLEHFTAWRHALVAPQGRGGGGPVDHALRALGFRRQVALSLSRFGALPRVLAESDLIACVPERFARHPEIVARCAVRELPFASPTFTLAMVWHRRYSRDPANAWLRSLMVETAATTAT